MMKRTKRIQNILYKNFIDFDISVIDDSITHKGHNNFDGKEETHIIIELKKKYNLKINRLETHKKINNLLSEEFKIGLHALQIKII
jgi:BolA protein